MIYNVLVYVICDQLSSDSPAAMLLTATVWLLPLGLTAAATATAAAADLSNLASVYLIATDDFFGRSRLMVHTSGKISCTSSLP